MDLYLIRHAIAGDPDAASWPDDRARPLTQAGVKRFRSATRGLHRIVPQVDLLLSSGYARAWQSAEILTKLAGWPSPVALPALEPDRSAEEVLAGLVEHAGANRIALVGHEPTLHQLVALLLAGPESTAEVSFKKGGAACVEIVDGLHAGGGRLRWLVPPKLLRMLD
jgi:phosphohistidine phosphatase